MIRETLANYLGEILHENWRKTRLKEDGTYEPRIKKTTDEEWILKHGTNEVDIANCSFVDLPSDWKYENLQAGKVAIDLVCGKVVVNEEINREEMASVVHDEWLKRNKWVYDSNYGNPVLTKTFKELPLEEQQKDVNQIILAEKIIKDYLNGVFEIEDLTKKYGIISKEKVNKTK